MRLFLRIKINKIVSLYKQVTSSTNLVTSLKKPKYTFNIQCIFVLSLEIDKDTRSS